MTFKVGDRVRYRTKADKGIVTALSTDKCVYVSWDGSTSSRTHEEMLIRLKPKRKAREYWLAFQPGQFTRALWTEDAARSELKLSYQSPSAEIIHVREVLKRAKA